MFDRNESHLGKDGSLIVWQYHVRYFLDDDDEFYIVDMFW
jgi:hypothetical protein